MCVVSGEIVCRRGVRREDERDGCWGRFEDVLLRSMLWREAMAASTWELLNGRGRMEYPES
jgi:hypothetical protein